MIDRKGEVKFYDPHSYDLTQFLDYDAMFAEFETWLEQRKT